MNFGTKEEDAMNIVKKIEDLMNSLEKRIESVEKESKKQIESVEKELKDLKNKNDSLHKEIESKIKEAVNNRFDNECDVSFNLNTKKEEEEKKEEDIFKFGTLPDSSVTPSYPSLNVNLPTVVTSTNDNAPSLSQMLFNLLKDTTNSSPPVSNTNTNPTTVSVPSPLVPTVSLPNATTITFPSSVSLPPPTAPPAPTAPSQQQNDIIGEISLTANLLEKLNATGNDDTKCCQINIFNGSQPQLVQKHQMVKKKNTTPRTKKHFACFGTTNAEAFGDDFSKSFFNDLTQTKH